MNISKEIEVKYRWDEESFLTASKIAYEYNLKHSFKRFIGWIFIIIAQLGVLLALKGYFGLLFISIILLIYWYILKWPIRAFFIKREFKKSNLKDKEFKVKINRDYIEINTIKIKWRNIKNIVSLKNSYLLELNNQMLFLPQDVFSKKEAREYFLKLAKSKGIL